MKIGFDAKRAFYNTRGLGNYSRNLIDGLLAYFPDEDYYLFGDKPKNGECHEWFHKIEKDVNIVGPNAKSSIRKALWRSYFMEDNIRSIDLDIYHGLSHEIPFKKRNKHTKYVVTIHDLLFLRFKQHFKWIDIQIYLSKIKYSCRHADLVLAVSEQTKQDLIDFLHIPEEKIIVNYQSCCPSYYMSPEAPADNEVKNIYHLPDNYYLFVGALVKHKNIERIIEAMALLPPELSYPLVIVGKGNGLKKALSEQIQKLRLSDKIQFIDYVKCEHMPSLYKLARLLIWPSLFEGFGIPIIEALFSKLPVITSNTGCFPEVGGPGAYYVNPESLADIVRGIEEVMSSPGKYREMQEEGYKYVQKFHLKNTTAHLMEIYSNFD
jgi:glycosyltransferase involved in cell wall biosynthesis